MRWEGKRFKLADGCMCERCAEKLSIHDSVSASGPKAFNSLAVNTVKEEIRHRQELGDEQWKAEQKEIERLEKEKRAAEEAEEAARKAAETVPVCPHCGCTSLSANKVGFDVGQAALHGSLFDSKLSTAAGIVYGNDVVLTCLNCGFQWKAGQFKK